MYVISNRNVWSQNRIHKIVPNPTYHKGGFLSSQNVTESFCIALKVYVIFPCQYNSVTCVKKKLPRVSS